MKTLPRSSTGLVRGFRAPVQQAVKEKKKKKEKIGHGRCGGQRPVHTSAARLKFDFKR